MIMKTNEEGMTKKQAAAATAATVLVMFGILALISWLKSRHG